MAIDRPKVIRDELDALGYSNVFSGDLTHIDSPDKVVSARDDTGIAPEDLLDGGDKAVNKDGMRIVVRGERDDIAEARSRARNIMQDLHKRDSITGFVSLEKRGGIFPMDRDEEGRPRFEINFIATIKE